MKSIYYIDNNINKPVELIEVWSNSSGYFAWVKLLYYWGYDNVELFRLK